VTDDAGALSDYIANLFAPEDPLLEEVRAEAYRRGLPDIAISAEVGRLLQVLLTAIGARRVLEIGTLAGYSAIWIARALGPEGRLVTLEIDPARADLARAFFQRAALEDRIEVMVGDAVETAARLARHGERFDAVFIDADKERYETYLELALEMVRPGGLILADNALWSGRVLQDPAEDDGTAALQAFNRTLARHPRLLSTIVPVRDGVAVGVVREGGESKRQKAKGG
jgi:caffeoyl-CoA O-methyltransferase